MSRHSRSRRNPLICHRSNLRFCPSSACPFLVLSSPWWALWLFVSPVHCTFAVPLSSRLRSPRLDSSLRKAHNHTARFSRSASTKLSRPSVIVPSCCSRRHRTCRVPPATTRLLSGEPLCSIQRLDSMQHIKLILLARLDAVWQGGRSEGVRCHRMTRRKMSRLRD